MRDIEILKSAGHLVIGMCLAIGTTASGMASLQQSGPTPSPTAPAESSPATTGQGPTTASQPAPASGTASERGQSCEVFMPDGQLKSHPVRVYVTRKIALDDEPRLHLLRGDSAKLEAGKKRDAYEPSLVAPDQEWTESIEGQQVRRSGTLLIFDLDKIDFGVRAMLRVVPVVTWTDNGIDRIAVGSTEVNIGYIAADVGWTLLVVILALLLVIGLSLRSGGNPFLLLTGVDGHLSLAQTQIACWTLVVGGVVLGYGLIRLQVPSIPPSLLILMGASLTTGGLGSFQDGRNQRVAAAAGKTLVRYQWGLGDLVRRFPAGQAPELSLAKAQMLFWTVILLTLFLIKSIVDGAIWEIPWALVALMGFSQAGYLAPKLNPEP